MQRENALSPRPKPSGRRCQRSISLPLIVALSTTLCAGASAQQSAQTVSLVPLAAEPDGGRPGSSELVSERAALPPADWQRFPLMMINLRAADLPQVADLVDVAAYYSTFAPFEAFTMSQSEADAASFRIDEQVIPIVSAAQAEGLHVTITPALLAHPSASTSNDELFVGNGVTDAGILYVNPAVVPGCNDVSVDPACIPVPTHYDAVTPEYIDYWAAKLPNFFRAVAAADPSGTVWGFYGAEEIRSWGPEYPAQRRLRAAIDNHPIMAGRLLLSSTPHHRMPDGMAASMLALAGIDGAVGSHDVVSSAGVPRSFSPVWDNPGCWQVSDTCAVLAFDDYYPLALSFATDSAGELMPIQDHMIRGNFVGYLLGGNSHVNRIASLHRMDAQIEALSVVRDAYFTNGQPPPNPLAFHAPDMNLCSLAAAGTSAAEARHDFWSGLHRGRGVFIYNYQFVVQAQNGVFHVPCPDLPEPAQVLTVWDEYATGLELIKSTLREYFLHGDRTYPVEFSPVSVSVSPAIAGTDYLIDNPIPGANATFAMPDYPAFRASSYRIDSTVYVIFTSSLDQEVEFTISFDDAICSASVVHGGRHDLSFVDNQMMDTVQGIDGRVYRVELDGGNCP